VAEPSARVHAPGDVKRFPRLLLRRRRVDVWRQVVLLAEGLTGKSKARDEVSSKEN
jgi:hypothetical protein